MTTAVKVTYKNECYLLEVDGDINLYDVDKLIDLYKKGKIKPEIVIGNIKSAIELVSKHNDLDRFNRRSPEELMSCLTDFNNSPGFYGFVPMRSLYSVKAETGMENLSIARNSTLYKNFLILNFDQNNILYTLSPLMRLMVDFRSESHTMGSFSISIEAEE